MPRFLLLLTLLLTPFAAIAQNTGDAPQLTEGPQAAAPAKPASMNNDAVLKMARAGLGDELILQTINTQPGQYRTDPDSLVALKQAGISDPIIAAMMNKSRRQLTPAPAPVVLSDVNEIGVYYKDRSSKWVAIEPEIVHLKSGGFLKSTVTDGIIKQDRNGHLNGRESALLLPRPIEFLIYTPGRRDGERVRPAPLPAQLLQPRVPHLHRRGLPLNQRRQPR
jgi:hypothetical protein